MPGKHGFILILMIGMQYFAAAGQTTRTSLSGRLSEENGVVVSGAYITLIHLPTGTVYGCASNLSGSYFFADLKPGGPYQIETAKMGLKRYQRGGIFLKLDEASVLNIELQSTINDLKEVVITAAKNERSLLTNKTGPGFNIRHQNISLLPTIKRSISDFVKLNPMAFGYAIAGGNYRQNFITIDGSEFNNNFGVGENLPGNGAQPVALDAIAEIAVNAAPYNAIWESGFIGSSINIVSRSGSNNTEGAVYSYFRNGSTYGHRIAELEIEKRPLNYHLEGLRLGGALIKNKLFYFLSFERETEKYQPQPFHAATDELPFGTDPNVARPSGSELNSIRNYLIDTYNYDPGPYQGYDFVNKSDKFLLRLDWNLAKNSTFNIRYNQLHSTRPELVNGSRSPLVAYSSSYGRRTLNALPFSNSNFITLSDFYSLSAEWNSKFSSNIANTMRSSYTRQYEPRVSDSDIFPFVDILKDGTPFTSFGYEPFSYGNSRDVYLISFTDRVSWSSGKGNWVAGVQADYSNTKNSYMPFATGYYTYATWDDFTGGKKPLDYAVTYTPDQLKSPPVYSFDYLNTAAFLQYGISISNRLSLTGGLRAEFPMFLKSLPENQELAALNFSGGRHLHTSLLPETALLLSPRVAFNYSLNADRSIRLRGGTGIFTGRIPFVWIISQARYSGVKQLTQTWQGQQNTPGIFNPVYQQQYSPDQAGALPSVISILSRDFKMPQSWKSSIGLDLNLPFGFSGSAEAIYNNDINGILFKDVNLVDPKPLEISGYPDHRSVYPSRKDLKFINPLNGEGQYDKNGSSALNAVEISNSSRGYYFSAIAQIERGIGRDFNFSVAYSRSSARNYNDGEGDQTFSALNATASVSGINQAALSYAAYVPPGRLLSVLSWSHPYSRHLKFNLGLVYQGTNEGRFSYTYSKDFIGDGTNRSLIYVPKDPTEIKFVPLSVNSGNVTAFYSSEEQSAAFFNYIEQDSYLRKRKGRYAERNAAILPWRNQFDLRISHDFSGYSYGKKHTLQLSCDLINVGNLIHRNWGLRKLVSTASILVPTNIDQVKQDKAFPAFQLATSGGKLVTETFKTDYSTNSTYSIQFGIRYLFE